MTTLLLPSPNEPPWVGRRKVSSRTCPSMNFFTHYSRCAFSICHHCGLRLLTTSRVQATLEKTKLDASEIGDICVGMHNICLHSVERAYEWTRAGTCHPPSPLYVSRAAALAAGIPDGVPISTVNRLCSSGLMAIRNIAHSIRVGEISLGVAVGVESMSLKYVHSLQISTAFLAPISVLTLSFLQSPAHSHRGGHR